MNTIFICHGIYMVLSTSKNTMVKPVSKSVSNIECVSCIEQPFCDTVTMPSSSLNLDVSLYIRLVSRVQLYCL